MTRDSVGYCGEDELYARTLKWVYLLGWLIASAEQRGRPHRTREDLQ